MIEQLSDPLTHMVRNSADHGIESPEKRLARGKPETGTIRLSAEQAGGNILIVVLILQITSIWNEFLLGLTFGGLGTQPMSVVLANVVITTTGEASYNENMAAALLTAIPPLVIYFLLGKFFVQGITAGAIKG